MAQQPRNPSGRGTRSFQDPVDPSASGRAGPREGSSDSFEKPPQSEDQLPTQEAAGEAEMEAEAVESFTIDNDVLAMKQEVEAALFAGNAAAAASAESSGSGLDLIAGVGIGPAYFDLESIGGNGPGAAVLNVYVTEPMSVDQCKAALVDSCGVHSLSSDDVIVNVITTGVIDAHVHRHRQRPAPCGISIGHPRVTAGTLGALARGRSGVRLNRLLVLSNNHVIANSNAAAVNDPILQPGPLDGGTDPADRIALLERWVTINFAAAGVNYVDAATGWAWPDRVRRDFIYRTATGFQYFRVGSVPVAAAVGMLVGKTGRTTQLRAGRIIDVSASIRVNYGGGRIANFRDQIAIRGLSGDFSQGGDSGSLIWQYDARRAPVGLLFAGGGGVTFGNKIGRVLAALDINLYT